MSSADHAWGATRGRCRVALSSPEIEHSGVAVSCRELASLDGYGTLVSRTRHAVFASEWEPIRVILACPVDVTVMMGYVPFSRHITSARDAWYTSAPSSCYRYTRLG